MRENRRRVSRQKIQTGRPNMLALSLRNALGILEQFSTTLRITILQVGAWYLYVIQM